MLVSYDGLYTLALKYGIPDQAAYLCLSALLVLLVYGYFCYTINKPKKIMLLMFFAAGLSIFSVIVAFIPGTGRLYIPFVFLSFIPIGDILCEMFSSVRSKQIKPAFVVLLTVVAAANMAGYTYQVYKTTGRAVQNDLLLRNASERIKNGEQIDSIDIKNYFNIESDALNPNEGIMTVYREDTIGCIKEYYDIPQSVCFNWIAKAD